MSERLSFYQLFAKYNYSIEIPIVQRDYAQGRTSVKEVRENFLDSLKKYLVEDIPFRDLDFVYGDLNQDKQLLPLDGQQRLTTLFLLHWYFAVFEKRLPELRLILCKDQISKFSYKTRQSASDFCDALLLHSIDLNDLLPEDEDSGPIAATIKDRDWYFLSWNNDPTIVSMLVMLDAIHLKFQNPLGFYEKLIDLEFPLITFQFLPLSNYGLTDDLYIKMNSRGKPLSRFENFKAKFEQHLSDINNSSKLQLSNDDRFGEIGVKQYFEHKIDTDWADLFWHFKDEKTNSYDIQIMNFISVIAINHYALSNVNVKFQIDHQQKLPFSFYTKLNTDFIRILISVFDCISIESTYKLYLSGYDRFNEISTFKEIINNNISEAGYSERIKFFAYYSFLARWGGDEVGLSEWMRFIVNLIENTAPYNNDTEFIVSLRAISRILHQSNCIIEYLTQNPKILGFNTFQIREEIIKAHLILKDKKWSDEIINAEKHPYFNGQLTFAIAFSGIEEYFAQNSNCEWDEDQNLQYFLEFKSYIEKVFTLFDKDGLVKEAKLNHTLHRAVLVKGDYLLAAKSNFSFLNDKGRDISWKRFLLGDGYRFKKRLFFKMVIDDSRFDLNDLASLNLFVESANPHITDWRRNFILQPELFNFMGADKYIRYTSSNEIDLLRGIKLSGEHVELHTYSLFLAGAKSISISPFTLLSNHSVIGDTFRPYIKLSNWKYTGKKIKVIIFHKNSNFYELRLEVYSAEKIFPAEIIEGVTKLGFSIKEGRYSKKVMLITLIKEIERLCITFKELDNNFSRSQLG